MSNKLVNLKPERVFYYFEELSKIPRESGNEKAVSDFLVDTAKKLGLEVYQDKINNIVIKKPATKGYENSDGIILQGHMDMVCEKELDSNHNFKTDGIDLIVDGKFLRANKTTLGADNGIAVAMGLAVLEDNAIEHPEIELLVTVEEETTMRGALELEENILTGKMLINIDSEEEAWVTVGSAGGKEIDIRFNEGKEKFEKVGRSSQLGYIAAFKNSKILHQSRFVNLKSSDLQEVFSNTKIKYGSKKKIKILFNQLYAYAMKNDIVTKDYSKYVDIGKNTEESTRKPFTSEEIKRLWDLISENNWIDTILIMIYTGFRIGELLEIKNSDIDLKNKIIKGGLKTEAGKDRLVPIHSKILKLVENRMNTKNEYLIVNFKGKQMKYDNYYKEKFKPIMEELGMNHKPHDTRHTFATLLSNADANKTSVKKLIGHNSYTTTEKFYTHKDIEELRKAVEKI